MRQPLWIGAAIMTLAAPPATAQDRASVLPQADQERMVCVPLRKADGTVDEGRMCKTGAQWEAALHARRIKGDTARDSADWGRSAYLASPYTNRLQPSILQSINTQRR